MLDFGLHNMDCMVGMKEIPDKYFELAIVDPPYGINAPNMSMGTRSKKGEGDAYPSVSTADRLRKGRLNQGAGKLKNRALQNMDCTWDFNPPGEEYFTELFRVSRNQIIWGGNYFDLPPTRGIAVWDKCQPWTNFSQCELAWTSFDCPAKIIHISNTGWSNHEPKIHPTQKPVRIYTWLLSEFAKKGDKILDTHAGSGSCSIACHQMEFDCMAFEIDKGYYTAAMKRLEEEQAQLRFDQIGMGV